MNKTETSPFNLSTVNFQYLTQSIRDYSGIVLDKSKQRFIYNRLYQRIHQLHLTDLNDYCEFMKKNKTELDRLVNVITTNVTSFFREPVHFDYFRTKILPHLQHHNQESRKIRIWSAGCSSGEEAYSLAMVISEVFPLSQSNWDIKILATDINTDQLAIAEKGIYSIKSIEDFTDQEKTRWFLRKKHGDTNHVKIKPALQKLITFKRLNLVLQWPDIGIFDVIFCRNVVVYFSSAARQKVFLNMSKHLSKEGFLVTGLMESFLDIGNEFTLIKDAIYTHRTPRCKD